MYCEIFQENLHGHVAAPELRGLLRAWEDVAADNGGRVPAELYLAGVDGLSDENMIVLEPLPGDDYHYARYGIGLVRVYGHDMTGRRLSFLDPGECRVLQAIYAPARERLRPVFAIHRASYAVNVHLWERMALPVFDEAGALRLVVFAYARETQLDLLEGVLRASPEAIVSCRALRDEAGTIVDAEITTANARALEFTGVPVDQLVDGRLREIFPHIDEDGTWERYLGVMRGRTPVDFEFVRPGSCGPRWFRAQIRPLLDGFIVSFGDITELKRALMEMAEQKRLAERALEEARRAEADAEAARAELAAEVEARRILEEELRRMVTIDSLTGVLNRRGFDDVATRSAAIAQRHRRPLSVIAIDLDRFKSINDDFGHAAGDAVLMITGATLQEQLRQSDAIGRVGGEEFMVLLPDTSLREAAEVAERLRSVLAHTPVQVGDLVLNVTASFGVQDLGTAGSAHEMMGQADIALYEAKHNGRNRVVVYGVAPMPEDDLMWA